ncbi:conjugal transfer protein, partial [Streptococcus pyogenes]
MQKAFERLTGVDIFSFKYYMVPTGFGYFNGVWVMINEILVNFFFFFLNAVVGFFSLLIRILENIDLYNLYKRYVYDGAKSIWQGFAGSNVGGIGNNSLVSVLLL